MPAERYPLPGGGGAVPVDVVEAARAAFSARRPDAETALLMHDSSDDVGSVEAGRRLAFAGGGIDVEVTLPPSAAVTGGAVVQVRPPSVERIDVRIPGGTETGATAEPAREGVWLIIPAPSGPVSLEVRMAGAVVCTEWVRW